MPRYQDVVPLSREEAAAAFATDEDAKVSEALVSITFHDPDWRWVQAHCLHFARHPSAAIRAVAATCLGHLARIHGLLDRDSVLPVLSQLAGDRETQGRAEDALEDIRRFLR